MPNQQLFDYIKQETSKGLPKEQIKQGLLTAGWPEADINEAFIAIEPPNSVPVPNAPMALASNANPIGSGSMLGVFDLLKKSFEIYKSRFWTMAGIEAVPSLLMFFFALVL